jgi:hypothetical protein
MKLMGTVGPGLVGSNLSVASLAGVDCASARSEVAAAAEVRRKRRRLRIGIGKRIRHGEGKMRIEAVD